MSASFWLRIGAIWGFLAVAMGAFGAHGLRERFESLGSLPGGLTDRAAPGEFPDRRPSIRCTAPWRSWPSA